MTDVPSGVKEENTVNKTGVTIGKTRLYGSNQDGTRKTCTIKETDVTGLVK